MFHIHAALVAVLALGVAPLARAQDLQRGDQPDAPGWSGGVTGLESDIAIRDSTRAAVAEDDGRTQLDEARLDSLRVVLASAREAIPREADGVRRAVDAVEEANRVVGRDRARARRERARLTALEKKVSGESGAPTGLSAAPDSGARR